MLQYEEPMSTPLKLVWHAACRMNMHPRGALSIVQICPRTQLFRECWPSADNWLDFFSCEGNGLFVRDRGPFYLPARVIAEQLGNNASHTFNRAEKSWSINWQQEGARAFRPI